MLLKLIDFGLVVLIWMTQLVVYPGFTYFRHEDLIAWHGKYTFNVSIIVMPLMLGQVAVHLWGVYQDFTIWRLGAIMLIGLAWVNTFFYAVPLHNKIAAAISVSESVKRLVVVNWFRTIAWSLVFLIGLFRSFKMGI